MQHDNGLGVLHASRSEQFARIGEIEDAPNELADLEQKIPNVRQVMLAALKNVRPSHLLDREVAEAWERCAGDYPERR